MALTPELTHGEPKHVEGNRYVIPVTLELKDGETTVFSFVLDVKHNASQTVSESLGADEVKYDLQQAINSYFKKESVKTQIQEVETTNTLVILKDSLEIPK